MVMTPAPAPQRMSVLRKRRPLVCLAGFHARANVRWRKGAEGWAVTLYFCRRCHRPLRGSHAAKTAVTGNK